MNKKTNPESGNAIFFILIAIALLGLLTAVVSDTSDMQVGLVNNVRDDEQINRLLSHGGNMQGAIQHMMVTSGMDDITLRTVLNFVEPGGIAGYPVGTNWATAPHQFKIHHPMGGGVTWMAATGNAANAATVAISILPRPNTILTGIGNTDVGVNDYMMTARINTAANCAQINEILYDDNTVPEMTSTEFNTLFNTINAITITNAHCATCVTGNSGGAYSQLCVKQAGTNAWGYYHVLLPG